MEEKRNGSLRFSSVPVSMISTLKERKLLIFVTDCKITTEDSNSSGWKSQAVACCCMFRSAIAAGKLSGKQVQIAFDFSLAVDI